MIEFSNEVRTGITHTGKILNLSVESPSVTGDVSCHYNSVCSQIQEIQILCRPWTTKLNGVTASEWTMRISANAALSLLRTSADAARSLLLWFMFWFIHKTKFVILNLNRTQYCFDIRFFG